jgi:hypothetical protein
LSWVCRSDNFENKVRRETGVTDKTARTQIYKEMLEHLLRLLPRELNLLEPKKFVNYWREWGLKWIKLSMLLAVQMRFQN